MKLERWFFMVKSDDLRVKRTRKLISQAFFTLLHKKKFEKILIQEIADSAMINRATFYAHYADKQDLYDSLIDQFLASFTGILDEQNLVDGNNVHVKEIETVLSRFYEFVRDNPEIAQMITDRAHDQRLKNRFLEILSERYTELFEKLEVREKDVVVPNDFAISIICSFDAFLSVCVGFRFIDKSISSENRSIRLYAVSYTHLTLPTILRV